MIKTQTVCGTVVTTHVSALLSCCRCAVQGSAVVWHILLYTFMCLDVNVLRNLPLFFLLEAEVHELLFKTAGKHLIRFFSFFTNVIRNNTLCAIVGPSSLFPLLCR